ncbi:MCM8 family protein [Megaselia abdita]
MSESQRKRPRWGTGGASIRRGTGRRGRGGLRRTTRFLNQNNDESTGDFLQPNLPVAAPKLLRKLTVVRLEENNNYPGWQLYFPEEVYDQSNETAKKIQLFEEHFLDRSDLYQLPLVQKNLYFFLNINTLSNAENFKTSWPTLKMDLESKPEFIFNCSGVAMHKLVSNAGFDAITTQSSSDSYYVPSKLALDKIYPRIIGIPPIPMSSISSANYDFLVTVRGTVTRISLPEILRTWQAFECPMCGTKQVIAQKKPKEETTPFTCFDDCRCKREFIPLQSSPFTSLEFLQTIHLSEGVRREVKLEAGIQILEVLLSNDLVDSFGIGSDITVSGILRVKPQEERGNSNRIYLEAVSVTNNKKLEETLHFTQTDEESIQLISQEPCPFRLLVQSFCPSVYGNEMVKAAILLSLFGGSGTATSQLKEIHVLLLGDPGVGKSSLLQFASAVAPKGVFLSGKTTGAIQLNVKSGRKNSFVDSAAFAMSDQGICCVDDLDKLSADQQTMIPLIEGRVLSISKNGVFSNIPVRSSIVAAVNPNGGHYDKSKRISENMRINPSLLYLFDLIFVMIDKPGKEEDGLMVKHIHEIQTGEKKIPSFSTEIANASKESESIIVDKTLDLEDRLRIVEGEKMDLIPPKLIKLYIAFAKKNIHPRLTLEAANKLKEFYLEMKNDHLDETVVTMRKMEGLVRMVQARARVELSKEANIDHVNEMISLIKFSQTEQQIDEMENVHKMKRFPGGSSSKTSQLKKFLKLLENRACSLGKTIFDREELKDLLKRGGITAGPTELIDVLNDQGILLKKGNNIYEYLME